MNPHARIKNPHEASESDYTPAINEILAQPVTADDVYEFGCWLSLAAKDGIREQLAEIMREYERGGIGYAAVGRAFVVAIHESRRVRAEQTVIQGA